MVRRKEHKHQTYVKMVAGKSSVSDNSIDGSLEAGKRTWREGVKLQSKRLEEKKCYESTQKRPLIVIYHRLNEYKCYHQMDLSGPKWTKVDLKNQSRANRLKWAKLSEVNQMDRNRLNWTE